VALGSIADMDPGVVIALLLVLLCGILLGAVLGALWAQGRSSTTRRVAAERALESRAGDQAVVKESLERLHDQMRDLEQHRIAWQSQLKQQVDEVRHSTDTLRRETTGLATALRRPQVRGRWGELHLRRSVEIAGMVDRCDFDEQVTLRADGQPWVDTACSGRTWSCTSPVASTWWWTPRCPSTRSSTRPLPTTTSARRT
jgi:DNA recombination protein RmuC